MKAQIVSFHCILKNKTGHVISSTFNQDVLTQTPDPAAPLPLLAKGLENLTPGERRKISLTADQAYGFYDLTKVITKTNDDFPGGQAPRVGDQVFLQTSSGQRLPFRVVEAKDEKIILDGNHPLAGQDLIFEVEAVTVREATPEEIRASSDSNGMAHSTTFH
jgi:FKBP-type peptidyl-prolyl cis-trans isomerase SlyD